MFPKCFFSFLPLRVRLQRSCCFSTGNGEPVFCSPELLPFPLVTGHRGSLQAPRPAKQQAHDERGGLCCPEMKHQGQILMTEALTPRSPGAVSPRQTLLLGAISFVLTCFYFLVTQSQVNCFLTICLAGYLCVREGRVAAVCGGDVTDPRGSNRSVTQCGGPGPGPSHLQLVLNSQRCRLRALGALSSLWPSLSQGTILLLFVVFKGHPSSAGTSGYRCLCAGLDDL